MLLKPSTMSHDGFTLVETIVAVAVLLIVALGMYQAFTTTMHAVRVSESKIAGIALVNEQMENVRNLAYDDVGVTGSRLPTCGTHRDMQYMSRFCTNVIYLICWTPWT